MLKKIDTQQEFVKTPKRNKKAWFKSERGAKRYIIRNKRRAKHDNRFDHIVN